MGAPRFGQGLAGPPNPVVPFNAVRNDAERLGDAQNVILVKAGQLAISCNANLVQCFFQYRAYPMNLLQIIPFIGRLE